MLSAEWEAAAALHTTCLPLVLYTPSHHHSVVAAHLCDILQVVVHQILLCLKCNFDSLEESVCSNQTFYTSGKGIYTSGKGMQDAPALLHKIPLLVVFSARWLWCTSCFDSNTNSHSCLAASDWTSCCCPTQQLLHGML